MEHLKNIKGNVAITQKIAIEWLINIWVLQYASLRKFTHTQNPIVCITIKDIETQTQTKKEK